MSNDDSVHVCMVLAQSHRNSYDNILGQQQGIVNHQ